MRARFLAILQVLSRPAVAVGGALVIAAGIVGVTWYILRVSPTGAYTAAAIAPITQEVDVSGPVQSAQVTNLSFQIAGQVARISARVGEHVERGQVLAALAGGAQAAALEGAQASLEAAQANQAALAAGTRPEQLAIDRSAVVQDTSALANALASAYIASDTAVHTSADQFFSNARTPSAALTVVVPDSVLAMRLVQERIALEPVLAAWGAQVSSISASSDLSGASATANKDLLQLSAFLDDAAQALSEVQASPAVPVATLNAYQASIAGARTSIASAMSAITGVETTLTAAQGALTLAQAGATPQALAGAAAQVDAAQAAVASAQVASGETALVAPLSGTITAQNADLGESVSPGEALISMQSDGAFEAKAPVSEADIGAVKVGDAVSATFDAYPGVSFPAAVTEVDPAATLAGGVASYTVTATFSGNDPRLQSGLTAHLAIVTGSLASALVVPRSSVIGDNGAQFVYVKSVGGPDVKTPVSTGIESAAGMVQILSGLSAGAQVLTFGAAGH